MFGKAAVIPSDRKEGGKRECAYHFPNMRGGEEGRDSAPAARLRRDEEKKREKHLE